VVVPVLPVIGPVPVVLVPPVGVAVRAARGLVVVPVPPMVVPAPVVPVSAVQAVPAAALALLAGLVRGPAVAVGLLRAVGLLLAVERTRGAQARRMPAAGLRAKLIEAAGPTASADQTFVRQRAVPMDLGRRVRRLALEGRGKEGAAGPSAAAPRHGEVADQIVAPLRGVPGGAVSRAMGRTEAHGREVAHPALAPATACRVNAVEHHPAGRNASPAAPTPRTATAGRPGAMVTGLDVSAACGGREQGALQAAQKQTALASLSPMTSPQTSLIQRCEPSCARCRAT
jgi:hypothetical protein